MAKSLVPIRAASRLCSRNCFRAPEDFESATQQLFVAARQGIIDGYIQEFVIDFGNFMQLGFLDTIQIHIDVPGVIPWASSGMVFNSQAMSHVPNWRWDNAECQNSLAFTPATVAPQATTLGADRRLLRGQLARQRTQRRSRGDSALTALAVTIAWLQKDLDKMTFNAIAYMWAHTTILRWTEALLLLTEILDPELNATAISGGRFCHLEIRQFWTVIREVISSTLCLPDVAFCPTILWIARRLCEDAIRCNGIIDRQAAVMVQTACQAALGIASQDVSGGYAQLIRSQTTNRHARGGRNGRMQIPWPSLRRSFINCPASFASSYGELRYAHATCATVAAGRFPLPEAFRCAWEALQRASLHGRIGNYVHDFVVRFHNFSDDGFLETIRHPAATTEGFSKWVAEGMICNQSSRPPDTVPGIWGWLLENRGL
jgi:hypothetical protein